jgi:two-component system, NarL family, nitrate/nitrite response regulator NarL
MNSDTTARTAVLIDDSEVDLFIQKRYIELSRFAKEVITFTSPVRALEALRSLQDPSGDLLIFLDLNMPILNGFEVLEKFQTIDSNISSRFKIVILTSSNSQTDRRRALEFPNVIYYLSKPITIAELNTIHHILDRKK